MGQRPVGRLAVSVPGDGAYGNLQGLVCRDNPIEGALQVERYRIPLCVEHEREGRKGWFFLHPLSVVTEAIDIPVTRRREVEFPIAGSISEREEELEARFFPQSVSAVRNLRRSGNRAAPPGDRGPRSEWQGDGNARVTLPVILRSC